MEVIISVGAGLQQLSFIKELKKQGYTVVAFDKDFDAIGKKYCDYFSTISTWEADQAIEWLSSLNLEFKGIGCISGGKALYTQQSLAHFFQLPGRINQDLMCLHDKHILRKRLLNLSLSTLEEKLLDDVQSLDVFLSSYPLILKPLDGSCSEGIILVNHKFPKDLNNRQYIVQRYLKGIDLRVSLIIQNGKICFLSVLEKKNLPGTFFTSRFTKLSQKYNQQVYTYLEILIKSMQIQEAIIRMDLILANGTLETLEVSFGISGDYFESYISQYFWGYDYYSNYIKFICGDLVEKFNCTTNKSKSHYNCFDYIYNIQSAPYCIKYNEIEKKLKKF